MIIFYAKKVRSSNLKRVIARRRDALTNDQAIMHLEGKKGKCDLEGKKGKEIHRLNVYTVNTMFSSAR